MITTELLATLRFTQPLNLQRTLRPDITRPFFETPLRPAAHDMLLVNTHPDLLPEPLPAPPRDLTFFNFDLP
ncbi:MAG: hypothetical protein WC205_07060 [Opitutaceae bacterium]|jgi:hypothetical protein